ncbi:hypothetical protein SLS55_008538 [Diplodia seriata]|uniref:Uncharacterized protein n=1 Tax=Diplodia seriata TaxID=420778 RepID=A0ABR3C8R3_9PEZI
MDEENQQAGPSAAAAGPAGRPAKSELVDNQNFEGQFKFGRLVVILSALAFTLFVSFLDQTSVSTALPAIATDLNAFETISWIDRHLQIPISGGGTTYDWSSPLVISFLVIGAILIIAFIVVQARFARHPTMPFRLFERNSAKILFAHNFISGVVYYTDLYYLPLYYQVILDKSPLTSGVLILPLILGFSLASAAGGFAIARLGRCLPVIRTGYVLWTAGAGGRIAFGPGTGIATIAGCLVVEGVGLGLSMQPVMIALLSNTRKEDRAVVTGLRNFLRTVGGAVGLGIAAAIINNVLLQHLPAGLPRAAASQLSVLLDTLPVEQRGEVVAVYMRGLHVVFILGAPLMGACLVSSAFLTDVPLATAHDRYKNEGGGAAAGGGEGVEMVDRGGAGAGASEKRKQSDAGVIEAEAGEGPAGAPAAVAEGETKENGLFLRLPLSTADFWITRMFHRVSRTRFNEEDGESKERIEPAQEKRRSTRAA